MSKHRVLSFKPQLRLEWRGQDGENETEQPDHSASLGDSITSSTRIRFSVHKGTADLTVRPPTSEFDPFRKSDEVLEFDCGARLTFTSGVTRQCPAHAALNVLCGFLAIRIRSS
jgi:hypothetical protein